MISTLEGTWLSNHPYLKPLSEFHALVDTAAEEVSIAAFPALNWANYLNDFHEGIPLLHSAGISIDLAPSAVMLRSMVERLASRLAGEFAEQTRAVTAELHRDCNAHLRAIDSLIGKGTFVSAWPGLLHFLGWRALARQFRPLADAFARWREEERWLRSYCPTCGSPPSMAQLVGTDPGRRRFLACARCESHWLYTRTGCPYCQNHDNHRLAILVIEGEEGLRIDYCESCHGYLKTYNGEGNESVLLADWTSIHLDFAAMDRGLKRQATSLLDFSGGCRGE